MSGTTVLVTEYAAPDLALPPHQVVFNSIGDADLCRNALPAAEAIVARTGRPVIEQLDARGGDGARANRHDDRLSAFRPDAIQLYNGCGAKSRTVRLPPFAPGAVRMGEPATQPIAFRGCILHGRRAAA